MVHLVLMHSGPCLFSLVLAAFLAVGFPLQAADRVALVMGNDAYVHAPSLRNPVRDAQAIAGVLEKAGYDVIRANDADVRGMLRALSGFTERARESEAAVFYYAGHGVEVKGENYLLPIDAKLAEEVDLDLETLPLQKVMANLGQAKATLKVIVLDCCRDNPLQTRSWMAQRSHGAGLAAVAENQLAEGTMLVYAGAPGMTVPDGAGGHSPFASALLEELAVPGASIAMVFSGVATKVAESEPWIRFDGSGKSFAAFSRYPLLPGEAPVAMVVPVSVLPPRPAEPAMPALVVPPKPVPAPLPVPVQATPSGPFTNTLGMKFVPVPGTKVLFSIWETRGQDYAAYAQAVSGVDMEWKDVENHGNKQASEHPVVHVSWEDAQAFCTWLSAKEKKTYRLPTDHEWSLAVGIGDRESATASPSDKDEKIADVYPWGTQWPPPAKAGNFYEIDGYTDQHPFTAPVGSYTANGLGIYDLGGNVYEWCEDWYDRDKSYRVLRGGSWSNASEISLRSSYRVDDSPTYRIDNNGFRCVLEVGSGG